MESLGQLLRRTIKEGAPLFNSGRADLCYKLYAEAVEHVLENEQLAASQHGTMLSTALQQAQSVNDEYRRAAWVLRKAFDACLESELPHASPQRTASAAVLHSVDATTSSTSTDDFYWQDEAVRNTSVQERAQSLTDTAVILEKFLHVGDNACDGSVHCNTFLATTAVELLLELGLAVNRAAAIDKLSLLVKAGFIRDAVEPAEIAKINDELHGPAFHDGTVLYRFATPKQLQTTLDSVMKTSLHEGDGEAEVIQSALQIALETDESTNSAPAASPMPRLEDANDTSSPEQQQGVALVQLLTKLEPHLAIQDRKYRLKTYPKSFLGSEAVDTMLHLQLADSRSEAVSKLNEILGTGLLHHVTHEHAFEDQKLYYRITAIRDVKDALDTLRAVEDSKGESTSEDEKIQYAALVERYKQAGATGLNVTDILNSFFGCNSEEGWDVVDLQNWRNNMKRWGFGRREDQDDVMVHQLSPLVANIDPSNWDVSGDAEWESPFGILAQIAIFDQVSRSAFRGTPQAFAWDELAIRATKVAIAKGYFDTAYKSTLNRFLILLPLEHSESWEDQKLGVHLLLKMLSTVAIEDEGISEYEIVKRLEFSKRLTTAFLEHAQVIAKFKRYPHRNRPIGRSTTLEERVWLASDLVPRWAKSQNKEDATTANLISLPVIPLKRLTKR